MEKGDLICTVKEVSFYYYGWHGYYGCHLIYTDNENFHVGNNISQLPNEDDCRRIYRNYYEE